MRRRSIRHCGDLIIIVKFSIGFISAIPLFYYMSMKLSAHAPEFRPEFMGALPPTKATPQASPSVVYPTAAPPVEQTQEYWEQFECGEDEEDELEVYEFVGDEMLDEEQMAEYEQFLQEEDAGETPLSVAVAKTGLNPSANEFVPPGVKPSVPQTQAEWDEYDVGDEEDDGEEIVVVEFHGDDMLNDDELEEYGRFLAEEEKKEDEVAKVDYKKEQELGNLFKAPAKPVQEIKHQASSQPAPPAKLAESAERTVTPPRQPVQQPAQQPRSINPAHRPNDTVWYEEQRDGLVLHVTIPRKDTNTMGHVQSAVTQVVLNAGFGEMSFNEHEKYVELVAPNLDRKLNQEDEDRLVRLATTSHSLGPPSKSERKPTPDPGSIRMSQGGGGQGRGRGQGQSKMNQRQY